MLAKEFISKATLLVIPALKSARLKAPTSGLRHLLLVLLAEAGIQKAKALDARLRTSGMTD